MAASLRRISRGRSIDLSYRRRGRLLDGDKILCGVACEEIGILYRRKLFSGGHGAQNSKPAKRALEGGVSGVHIVGGAILMGFFEQSRWRNQKRPLALTRFPGTRIVS